MNTSRRAFLGKAAALVAVVAINPLAIFLEPREVRAAGNGFIIDLADPKYADLSDPTTNFSMFISVPTQKRSYAGMAGSALLPYAFVITRTSDAPPTFSALQGWCTHRLSAMGIYNGTDVPCSNTDFGHKSTFSLTGAKIFSAGGSSQAALPSYPATYDAKTNTVTVQIAGLGVKDGNIVMASPELFQNTPNPVAGTTTIKFRLYSYSHVRLFVTDALGHTIGLLHDGELGEGEHSFQFDASIFPSGTYFYHLDTGVEVLTKQFVVVK
ncbi:MAG: T9SS type A sorting domain-containing protein [bacterium]